MYYNLHTKQIVIDKKTKTYETDNFIAYWEGLIFVKGTAPGEKSIIRLIDELKKTSISKAINILSGTFCCVLEDKKNNITYSFSDNLGMYNFFRGENFVSSSFLKAIKENHIRKKEIDPIAITDFIVAASCMRWNTFFKIIKKVKYDEIIKASNSDIKIIQKEIPDIFSINQYPYNIIERFKPIAKSLKKLDGKISLDLTSGLDTRMIGTIFNYYGIDYETATCGVIENDDVEISKDVAKALNKDHFITYHRINSNSIVKELDEAFYHYDALTNLVLWHLYYKFQLDKYKRNNILTISGHAGEFYKNIFIWELDNRDPIKTINQLFKKKTSIRYGLGHEGINYAIYTNEYKNYFSSYEARLKDYFIKNYGFDNSGRTGPKIYAYIMEGSRTSNQGALVDRFSPLLDYDIIPCGTTLKDSKDDFGNRLKRFIKRPWNERLSFEKQVITYLDKRVARVISPKYFGFSYSSARIDQIKDSIRRIGYDMKIKFGHIKYSKILGINPNIFPIVKSLTKTQEMVEILKNEGILLNNMKIEDIDDLSIGSLYTIAKLFEYLDNLN